MVTRQRLGGRSNLLDREYALQSGFHNALRDRIGFTLLPEKRYAEAAALARQVPRPYAVEALLAFISTEKAYRSMSDDRSAATGKEDESLRQNFCSAMARLRSATRHGYARDFTRSRMCHTTTSCARSIRP